MKSTIDKFSQSTPAQRAQAVGLFKVLSHPHRLRLACALGDGRVTTQKELVEEFGWPQSTVARHVAALRSLGLVISEREGTEVFLRLGNAVALHLVDIVCDWVHEDDSENHGAWAAAAASPSVGDSLEDDRSWRDSF